MGGELVWLHVGQAGIQVGDELWNIFAEDHDLDGPKETPSPAVFYAQKNGEAAPRNLLVDTEQNIISDTLKKKKRNPRLFSRSHQIHDSNGSGGLYPVGYRSLVVSKVEEKTRLLLEEAEGPKGFVFIYGSGGGTGSGVTSNLSEGLESGYGKMSQVHFVVSPNPSWRAQSTSTVEAYNAGLMAHSMKDSNACLVLVDNDSMYYISEQKSSYHKPEYSWINQLFSHAIGTVSAGWRFPANPAIRFEDMPSNLVPFPSAKYSVMSFAPMFQQSTLPQEMFLTGDLSRELFETRSYLIRCNPRMPAFSSIISYRGTGVRPIEISQALAEQVDRGGARFVSWMKPSFKIGITAKIPPSLNSCSIPKCASMVANTTAIKPTWQQIHYQFSSLLKRKAFLHWYQREGLNSQAFVDAEDTLLDIISAYEGI